MLAASTERRRFTIQLRSRMVKLTLPFPPELKFQLTPSMRSEDVFAAQPFVIEDTVVATRRYVVDEYHGILLVHVVSYSPVSRFAKIPAAAQTARFQLRQLWRKDKLFGSAGTVFKFAQDFSGQHLVRLFMVTGNEHQTDIISATLPADYDRKFIGPMLERLLHAAERSRVRFDDRN